MKPEQTAAVLEAGSGDPVAFWTFTEEAPPYRDVSGAHLLLPGDGSAVQSIDDAAWGRAATFDGRSDFLRIAAADVGDLNVAPRGDDVTVLAWVRRRTPWLGFVAGMWQEHDDDPRRQYGLFTSLGLYGGKDRVAGHLSQTGAASAGLPYSRDACASARMIEPESARMIGFSYDGHDGIAYLDGIADRRPHFVDPPAPFGQGLEYAKNPYVFPDGLNRRAVSDFTVGAVLLSRGLGNFFGGEIGGVAIYDRVLSPAEIMDIHLRTKPAAEPIADLGFYRADDVINEHHVAREWPVSEHGWMSMASPEHVIRLEGERGYLSRPGQGSAAPGACLFAAINDLAPAHVTRVEFDLDSDVPISVMVQVSGRWYARDVAGETGEAATGWRTIRVPLRAPECRWRCIDLTDLTAADAGRPDDSTSSLPTGQITALGILDHGLTPGEELRLSHFRIF